MSAGDDREAIRRLKARYFRLIDTKQWDELPDVFTADFAFYRAAGHIGPPPDEPTYASADAFVAAVAAGFAEAVTAHHGHMPEIDLLDATRARGIWAMEDRVLHPVDPTLRFRGAGHYRDEYAREGDGRWRIRSSRLSRLWLEPLPLPAG
jgi:hypothetical protein